jgi:hypothetical protein
MLEDCLPKATPEGWRFLWRQKMWNEDVASFERFDGLSLTVCVVQRDGKSILDCTVSVLKPNCLPTHSLLTEAVTAYFPQLKGKTLTVLGTESRKRTRKIRQNLLRAEVELSMDDVVTP